jgi:hypothetical protein
VIATDPRLRVIRGSSDLPQDWDEAGAQWDQAAAKWDPPPPPALFAGALLGTGVLEGLLVLGVVDLEGPLTGDGTLAGTLATGQFLAATPLTGTAALTAPDLKTGVVFHAALLGRGTLTGTFFEPPSGAVFGGALTGVGTLVGVLPAVALLIPHRFGPDSPESLTPHLDADFDAILDVVNAPGMLGIGPLAARPVAGHPGAIYVATDSNDEWWMDDGATWQAMGAFGLGMVVHDAATDQLLLLGAPAAGLFGLHMLAAAKATVIPTQAIVDGAVLYVADTQGIPGRAAWHHLSEAGTRTPLDPVLFRDGFHQFNNEPSERTLFANGAPTLRGTTLLGRYLEIWWRGDVRNDSGAVRGLTLRLRYGGTEIATVAMPAIPITATPLPLSALFRLDGLTGAVQLGLPVSVQSQGTATLTGGTAALDATLDQPLDCTAQCSAPHPALEIRTHGIQVVLR